MPRVFAETNERADTGRVHELDAVEVEHDLVRVRRQSGENTSADDARREDVEDAAQRYDSYAELVDDGDLRGSMWHGPVLAREIAE
jgi:hypothetical protein